MKKTLVIAALAFAGGIATRAVAEPQPHMQQALAALQSAKASLQNATADKGGHRAKAIDHVNAAIEQVEKGIAFDNKH